MAQDRSSASAGRAFSNGFERVPLIEPVDPVESRELDGLEAPARPSAVDVAVDGQVGRHQRQLDPTDLAHP